MNTIKIKLGNKYPRFFDLLYFILQWFAFKPVIEANFIMPELDNSGTDPIDKFDWKKLLGINLCPSKPSNYKSIQVGFRSNHATGKWDFVGYYNSPTFKETFKTTSILLSIEPNKEATVKLIPVNDSSYGIQFFVEGEAVSDLHTFDFESIASIVRLSSTHYGGEDNNGDGIGNGYPGPGKWFKLKINLKASPQTNDKEYNAKYL